MSAQFNNCHFLTTDMGAKPYSPGHIGAVAANYTQMRISEQLNNNLSNFSARN